MPKKLRSSSHPERARGLPSWLLARTRRCARLRARRIGLQGIVITIFPQEYLAIYRLQHVIEQTVGWPADEIAEIGTLPRHDVQHLGELAVAGDLGRLELDPIGPLGAARAGLGRSCALARRLCALVVRGAAGARRFVALWRHARRGGGSRRTCWRRIRRRGGGRVHGGLELVWRRRRSRRLAGGRGAGTLLGLRAREQHRGEQHQDGAHDQTPLPELGVVPLGPAVPGAVPVAAVGATPGVAGAVAGVSPGAVAGAPGPAAGFSGAASGRFTGGSPSRWRSSAIQLPTGFSSCVSS